MQKYSLLIEFMKKIDNECTTLGYICFVLVIFLVWISISLGMTHNVKKEMIAQKIRIVEYFLLGIFLLCMFVNGFNILGVPFVQE